MFHQSLGLDWNVTCDVTTASCNRSIPSLPSFTTAAKVRVAITFALFVVAAFCNLVVLWRANWGCRRRKSRVRLLISHLSAADLLVTFIVMPLDACWNVTVQWLAGDIVCRLLMFLKLVAMYSCSFITVVISLDRQAAILDPLAISQVRRRNRVLLGGAWSLSAVLSLPQLFLFQNVTLSIPEHFTQCSTHGSFQQRWQETLYNMFTFCCLFLVPLIIMISCYVRILMEISTLTSRSSVDTSEVHLRSFNNNIPKARMRTLKMTVVIVASFVVCWTPYYLLGIWYWFSPHELEQVMPRGLSHFLFLFGLLNACLDPLIYGLFTLPPRSWAHPRVAMEMEPTTHTTSLSWRRLATSEDTNPHASTRKSSCC